jgi:hypothetical protein
MEHLVGHVPLEVEVKKQVVMYIMHPESRAFRALSQRYHRFLTHRA